MLRTLRNKKQSILMLGMVGIVIFLMAGFGIDLLRPDPNDQIVARIDDKEISQLEYLRKVERLRSAARARFGANFSQIEPMLNLKQKALDGMIEETLFDSFTSALKLAAGKKEIEKQIRALPVFAKGFSRQAYISFRNSVGVSDAEMKRLMGKQIVQTQLLSIFSDWNSPSDIEIKNIYRVNNTKKQFQYITLDPQKYLNKVNLSDENKLKTFFDDNIEKYRKPTQISLSLVAFKPSEFADKVEVTEDDINFAYNENKAKFRYPATFKIRQVVIKKKDADINNKTDSSNSAEKSASQPDQALVTAEKIRKLYEDGSTFEELVKQYSEDELTKGNAGSLGWMALNQLEPNIKKAIAKMDVGEVSSPIKLPKAYYLVFLEDIKPSGIKALKDVRAEVEKLARREQAPAYAQAEAEEFLQSWLNSKKDLNSFAKNTAHKILNLDNVSVNSKLPPEVPLELVQQAIQYGTGAKDIINLKDTAIVFENTAFKESYLPEFNEVKSEVIENFKQVEAKKLAKEDAFNSIKLLEDASNKIDKFKEVASGLNLTPKETLEVGSQEAQKEPLNNPQIRQQAFALQNVGDVSKDAINLGNKYLIIMLSHITPATSKDFDKQKTQIVARAAAEGRQRIFKNLIDTLKASHKIWINPDLKERNI